MKGARPTGTLGGTESAKATRSSIGAQPIGLSQIMPIGIWTSRPTVYVLELNTTTPCAPALPFAVRRTAANCRLTGGEYYSR